MRNGRAARVEGRRWLILARPFGSICRSARSAALPGGAPPRPMGAAIVVALLGARIEMPARGVVPAQGIVGLMIGGGFPPGFLQDVAGHWPVVLCGTAFTIVISTGFGWLLSRSKHLPGPTAVWGFSAGAASVMTFMSRDYGADFRLVAFMQYLRVACVALAAGAIVRVGQDVSVGPLFADWFPPVSAPSYLLILRLLLASRRSAAGRVCRAEPSLRRWLLE